MAKKRLVVLFPGRNYSVNMPLLYYGRFKYEVMGYESVDVHYGNCCEEGKLFVDCLEGAKSIVI